VCIVHDWFQGFHGSERVVQSLVTDVFADAAAVDIQTFHAARELLPADLAGKITRESRLAALPGIRQVGHDPGRWRYLLPYMPRYFRSLDLDSYDLVVASSHACAMQANPPPGVPYLCYCHTPMRYAWLSEIERGRRSGIGGAGLRVASAWLRRRDSRAASRPDRFAANSTAVRDRIARFYGRDAEVVHPPVAVDDLAPDEKPEQPSFLWVNRLVPYKRPELVVEAFRNLPYRLTMVGLGPLEDRLRASLPANVELLGWIPRPRLAELFARATGFLHVGEEDFGLTMVEALASGTPVIALRAGGALDIVRDGVDGVLVDAPAVAAVQAGVRRLLDAEWDPERLASRAADFSPAVFSAGIRQLLEQTMAGSSA
jgi:glycosyltransferase involved in cell wall biosynthesis